MVNTLVNQLRKQWSFGDDVASLFVVASTMLLVMHLSEVLTIVLSVILGRLQCDNILKESWYRMFGRKVSIPFLELHLEIYTLKIGLSK